MATDGGSTDGQVSRSKLMDRKRDTRDGEEGAKRVHVGRRSGKRERRCATAADDSARHSEAAAAAECVGRRDERSTSAFGCEFRFVSLIRIQNPRSRAARLVEREAEAGKRARGKQARR